MEPYKSEIRESDLQALQDKVASGSYHKYLRRLTLTRVRGFADREVTFDFPVTALIGPNGGGKTTILGAAALIYEDVAPRTFFAKSGAYDSSMKDWSIEYDLFDRDLSARTSVARTASYKRAKWNRSAVTRPVLIFGVERTLPATERRELVKAVGGKFAAARESALSERVADHVSQILGKPIEGYSRLEVDTAGRVTMFAGQTATGAGYSEFHFGAGEASIIRIVAGVEAVEENALILIEEIENGLHPVATRRVVEYLLTVARRKKCQVIFTTHSKDALDPLPPRAIWAAYDGDVLQGKLDIAALSVITGRVEAELAIFVEDEFAQLMTLAALRYYGNIELKAIKIQPMGGAGPALKVNEQHNIDPTAQYPSICLLDADQEDKVDSVRKVYSLPGIGSPERYVFDCVRDMLDTEAARLTVSLHLPVGEQDRVVQAVEQHHLTNRDPHVIFEQIGATLDFTSRRTVAEAFISLWAQTHPQVVQDLVNQFKEYLPLKSRPDDEARLATGQHPSV